MRCGTIMRLTESFRDEARQSLVVPRRHVSLRPAFAPPERHEHLRDEVRVEPRKLSRPDEDSSV